GSSRWRQATWLPPPERGSQLRDSAGFGPDFAADSRRQDATPAATRRPMTWSERARRRIGAPASVHVAVGARPVAGPQRLLVGLAQGADRDLVDEVHGLRRLNRALGFLDHPDELLGLDRGTGPELDHGLDGLAPAVVGHADDRHVGDRGVRRDHVLDLAGEDAEPAGDDHVLLAVDDRQVPVLVL